MPNLEIKEHSELYIEILTNHDEILDHLHLGISIPILPEFKKYILGDIKAYNAKAIVLEKNINRKNFRYKTDTTIGNVLIYDDGGEILFFGFFGVYDHDSKKIKYLIDKLIEYAKVHNYKKIRGPINIPTVIFGWGFMVEGSKKDLFICSPINPPIYQKIFFEKGFKVLFQEDRYEVPALKMDPHKNKRLISMGINTGNYKNDIFDTGDYPYKYINPGKEELLKIKKKIAEMYFKYMPPSAQITPRKLHNAENIINFIDEFGSKWMMWIVRHKKTNQMVANGYVIPNIFHKNNKGELDSLSFHSWVVHRDHRRKYLTMLMYGLTVLQAMDKKTPHFIRGGSWPVGSENIANASAARKMGGKKDRSHLILEYSF